MPLMPRLHALPATHKNGNFHNKLCDMDIALAAADHAIESMLNGNQTLHTWLEDADESGEAVQEDTAVAELARRHQHWPKGMAKTDIGCEQSGKDTLWFELTEEFVSEVG